MRKLTFELEFITPAFIGGAEPGSAELRPASFVGLLRWWWRALKGLDKMEDLYREECEIFGGQLREGSRSGKVWFKLWGEPRKSDKPMKERYSLEWSYINRRLVGEHAGIGYLLYSVNLRTRHNLERTFLEAGSKFWLQIFGEEQYLKHVVASLWALIYLGGVGSRSRRGAGNFDCLKVEPPIDWLSFKPDQNIFLWLSNNLKKAIQLVNGGKDFCAKYSNLSLSKIMLSNEEFDSWQGALNHIGKIMMNFRRENRNRVFEMGAFGLPIRHSDGSFLKAEKHHRRASPTIIKVLRVENKYIWMVLKLSGEPLPEGEQLIFNRQKGKMDYSILEDFRLYLRKNNLAKSYLLTKPESLERITILIKENLEPQRIILMGSRARGDASINSPIDLVVEGSNGKPLNLKSVDERINLIEKITPMEENAINREGVLLYERK
ncbi:MAG: type III-B CRISPR module RAMP protein Cmr1 [Aquificaceae bacterium]|nr:type III-B CRISPR module RAMP protein Cmr1 [Aquificaceae bacterium]